MRKVIVYVDMDNVLVDFKSAITQLTDEVKEEYEGRLDEVPGIFSQMKPMAGAIEGYEALAKKFDTYILSTAPWQNPSAWQDKLLWVQKYLGKAAHKRLILSHNKNLNRGDYLIDDRDKNGAGEFDGSLIRFGSTNFADWSAVVKFFKFKPDTVTAPISDVVGDGVSASSLRTVEKAVNKSLFEKKGYPE